MNDIYVTFAASQEVLKNLQIKTVQHFHIDLEVMIKYGDLQTADQDACGGQLCNNNLLEIFTVLKISLCPKWYIYSIFNKESRKALPTFGCVPVTINVLICAILNMISSSWSFSQNPQIMTCYTNW